MKLSKCLKLAFNILRHNKLRSWLSILGIVIGVASVIAILSLGQGMQQDIEARLGGMGADMITVSAGASRAMGGMGGFRDGDENRNNEGSNGGSSSIQKNLTNRDVQALKLITNIGYIQGTVSKRGSIGYLDETTSATVKGVDTTVWKDMETAQLESGRFLVPGDKYVAVISSRIAKDRFKQDIPLNRQITIDSTPFRVVGILAEAEGMGGRSSSDIYIPVETARTLEGVEKKGIGLIEIRVNDIDQLDDTLAQIEKRLMLTRAVTNQTKDFTVNSVKAMQETISSTINTMSLFLGAIAAISLLVGAIGIANTMFTTVLEKTKDIGVMKAIGAKDKDIMMIFLFNSGMIGLTGGLIGGLFGIIGSKILSMFISSMMAGSGPGGRLTEGGALVTPQILLLVIGISALIGIMAGVIPAYKASKMNPVDALKYE